jgi:hypothetical protein
MPEIPVTPGLSRHRRRSERRGASVDVWQSIAEGME